MLLLYNIVAIMAIIAIIAVVAVVAIMAAIAKDSANQISKVGILPNAVRTLLSYHLCDGWSIL